MATAPTDIVTVAELKDELRFDADDDSQDDLLTNHIAAAVNHVESMIALPLLTKEVTVYAAPARQTYGGIYDHRFYQTLRLKIPHLKELVSVKYWGDKTPPGHDPDETIPLDTLGRLEPFKPLHEFYLYPPDAGWPVTTSARHDFQVVAMAGIDFGEGDPDSFPIIPPDPSKQAATASLRYAVRLIAVKFYDGESDSKSIDSILAPWRRYD